MDEIVCVSSSFSNKQNARSFANLFNLKILKSDDEKGFLLHIFGDGNLVSELPYDLRECLLTLKKDLRDNCNDDFKNFFPAKHNKDVLSPVSKTDIFNGCLKAMHHILPSTLYGRNNNQKLFKKLIHLVIYSMKLQHIDFKRYLLKWDFSPSPWKLLPETISKTILHKVILWILQYVLSPVICLNFFVTTCKFNCDEYKLYYFWKNEWQSFYDTKISKLIFTKVLKKYNGYSVGKKVKTSHSLTERLRIKNLHKDIPKLHLILKPNNDCRPIVRYKNAPQNTQEKYKMRERLHFLKSLIGTRTQKIETQYNTVYRKWLELDRPELYFVKTDLSNAFGAIIKEKLLKILSERHLNFQNKERNVNTKRKFAQLYKEFISELRKPLLVRAGSTVYEWTEGLVQGYKYSPALSELYYAHLDEIYFADILKSESQIKLFKRVVDDYLFVTDSFNSALEFLDALSNYRNVNYDKTVINFNYPKIKFSDDITFLGYHYNTNTLEVSRAKNVFVGQMCYKIAFTKSIVNITKFLENRIGQSGIHINGHIFNLNYNSEHLVWRHIFTTFCLSANKFCTILSVLCEEKDMRSYLSLYKKKVTVKLGNTIIETIIKNKQPDDMFVYCINHIRYISLQALYLCAVKTRNCTGLVPYVKDELAKSNCIFGTWREHACRMDSNGAVRREAIKDVCRRFDLRVIFKSFDKLPQGFQCYDSRM